MLFLFFMYYGHNFQFDQKILLIQQVERDTDTVVISLFCKESPSVLEGFRGTCLNI